MHDTKLELIVGVFVLVGIAALAYIAIKLGKLEVIGGGNQIEVQAEFDSVAGLKPGASVEIAGVQVGHVKRSEEHTSELQSRLHLVCRLLLEKKKQNNPTFRLDVNAVAGA